MHMASTMLESLFKDSDHTVAQVGTLTTVYRPMGDKEFAYLSEHGLLPDTQPYQTIVEGESGRIYAEKYLRGKKWVDSHPTTVVEFIVPKVVVSELFRMQQKVEDGCLSHGLGHKGGKGLPLFNACLKLKHTSWKIVLVKRKGRKILCHEKNLVKQGKLKEITHNRSTSRWLYANSTKV